MGWVASRPGNHRFYITGWFPLCVKLGLKVGHSIQLDVDPADHTRLQLSLLSEGTCPEEDAQSTSPQSNLPQSQSAVVEGQPLSTKIASVAAVPIQPVVPVTGAVRRSELQVRWEKIMSP